MPVFCFLKADTHLYTSVRQASQEREQSCSGRLQYTPACVPSACCTNKNNIHAKIQPSCAKSAQSTPSLTVYSSSECSAVTLPVSLVSKSADVVSGTVSGEKESSGKCSCFCKAFQVFGLRVTQGAAGKFCSCTTIILEVKEILENLLMMFGFFGAQELRTFTFSCKDCNWWLF